jgi:hypothetical protein
LTGSVLNWGILSNSKLSGSSFDCRARAATQSQHGQKATESYSVRDGDEQVASLIDRALAKGEVRRGHRELQQHKHNEQGANGADKIRTTQRRRHSPAAQLPWRRRAPTCAACSPWSRSAQCCCSERCAPPSAPAVRATAIRTSDGDCTAQTLVLKPIRPSMAAGVRGWNTNSSVCVWNGASVPASHNTSGEGERAPVTHPRSG